MKEYHKTEYRILNKLMNRAIQKQFGDGIKVRLSSLVYLCNRDGRIRLTEKVYIKSNDTINKDTLNLIEVNLITNLNRLHLMVSLRQNVSVKRVVLVVRRLERG